MIGRGKGDSDNGPTNTGRLTTPNVLNGGYNALSGQGPAPQFGQTTSILNRGYNALSGIGPEYSQYSANINNSLQSHLDPDFNPPSIPRQDWTMYGNMRDMSNNMGAYQNTLWPGSSKTQVDELMENTYNSGLNFKGTIR
jgi:hypothetical protein